MRGGTLLLVGCSSLLPPPSPTSVKPRKGCNACSVFDEMPTGSDDETRAEEGTACLDRISALPDEVIHQVLGLLPAPEAVRTSVLARGWRHHWKYMRRLVFTVFLGDPVLSLDWLNRFMAHLLRDLRPPLDVCDIYVEEGHCDEDTAPYAYRWVRQAVSKLNVRELIISLELQFGVPSFELTGQPLVSRRLVRLELYYVELKGRILDFSKCTALEDLVIYKCDISTKNISSRTLKHLRIERCDFCRNGSPTCNFCAKSGFAKIGTTVGCRSCSSNNATAGRWQLSSFSATIMIILVMFKVTGTENVVAFVKVVVAVTLIVVAVACFSMFTDFKCYPTFSKLRTLLLGEWCLAANLHALICILLHAQVLENLTIELKGYIHKNTMELEGNHNPIVPMFAVSEHLKFVKIKHRKNDERVSKLSNSDQK
ncbi:hypothetical protein EJB05_36950, partial [Eragrostis curvula]